MGFKGKEANTVHNTTIGFPKSSISQWENQQYHVSNGWGAKQHLLDCLLRQSSRTSYDPAKLRPQSHNVSMEETNTQRNTSHVALPNCKMVAWKGYPRL